MNFIETRGNDGQHPEKVTFSEAILAPISSYGGLYSPESLPELGESFLNTHVNSNYKTLANAVLSAFDIDIDATIIGKALDLYDAFDDPSNPVPVVKVKDDLFVSELWHGPTRAFKDMALQPFGTVLSSIPPPRDANSLILPAPSRATGRRRRHPGAKDAGGRAEGAAAAGTARRCLADAGIAGPALTGGGARPDRRLDCRQCRARAFA